jgi:hypothetical protein
MAHALASSSLELIAAVARVTHVAAFRTAANLTSTRIADALAPSGKATAPHHRGSLSIDHNRLRRATATFSQITHHERRIPSGITCFECRMPLGEPI